MEIIELNSIHQTYLAPIQKWRIIDLKGLRSEYDFNPHYVTFCRVIRKLERMGVLGSYRQAGTRQKFVFLTPLGEKLVALAENPTAVSKETLLHDLKASQLVRMFRQRGWILSGALEHELHNKRQFGSSGRVVPDASLEGMRLGKPFKLALEVELTVKSHARIQEKVRQYLEEATYDNVLYFFERKNHMENYYQMLAEKMGEAKIRRVMFFWWDWSAPIEEAQGLFKGEKKRLGEIFA